MAKQRYVKDSFWADPYIESLNTSEKLLFLYLLTNTHVTVAGVYETTIRQMSFESGIDQGRLQQAIDKLSQDGKILYENNWMVLINFIKNQSMNPSMQKGVERTLKSLPDWLVDRLSTGGGDALTYFTLLNFTLPNLTEFGEGVEEEVKDEFKNELEEYIEKRNSIKPFGMVKKALPKTIKLTDDLLKNWKTKRKSFDIEDINKATKNYIKHMTNIKPKFEGDTYHEHRFSIIEFLTRKGGLEKFINYN